MNIPGIEWWQHKEATAERIIIIIIIIIKLQLAWHFIETARSLYITPIKTKTI
jgi:hypothetical protein